MKNKQYTITLSDYMKKYQTDNDIKTKIEIVELVDKKQLKNKRPKFIINKSFVSEQAMRDTVHLLSLVIDVKINLLYLVAGVNWQAQL